MSTETGWVWLDGHIVGNMERGYECLYNWNGATFTTQQAAMRAGLRDYGSDDFNVGHLVNGTLVWFGWMEDQHPVEDYASVAEQFGWASPAVERAGG